MGKPTRQDTWRLTLSIDGLATDVWDKKTGGKLDSEAQVYRPGGMGPQISLGGAQTVEPINVSRLFDQERDGITYKEWANRRGRAAFSLTQQPLDVDGNVWNTLAALTYTGTVKAVDPPEVDSEGGDAAMIDLELTPNGTVG